MCITKIEAFSYGGKTYTREIDAITAAIGARIGNNEAVARNIADSATDLIPLLQRVLEIGGGKKAGDADASDKRTPLSPQDRRSSLLGRLQAWAQRKGVCQDIAHLALGALRSVGIPARYVSGYLHPKPNAAIGETGGAGRGRRDQVPGLRQRQHAVGGEAERRQQWRGIIVIGRQDRAQALGDHVGRLGPAGMAAAAHDIGRAEHDEIA